MAGAWALVASNARARSSRLGLFERLLDSEVEPLSFSESSKIIPILDVLRLVVFPSVGCWSRHQRSGRKCPTEPISRRLGGVLQPHLRDVLAAFSARICTPLG